MIYFIPAWYKENTWNEREQKWYLPQQQSEFDDTIKQIQLFHRSKSYEYEIALLSYAPNLRHFLHRHGIYRAPYWSCFDSIQNISRRKVRPLSFYNFKWPKGIEFIYTPFLVDAYLKGEKYAAIEFGEDGNPIQVDMYKAGILVRRNLYDDRGFLSSTIVCLDGRAIYQDYLDEEGIWKIREYKADGHVEINPQNQGYSLAEGFTAQIVKYKQDRYDSIGSVISEVFKAYMGRTPGDSIYCVAMHKLHIDILDQILINRNTILSVFSDRYRFNSRENIQTILDSVNYIITDSKNTINNISDKFDMGNTEVIDISPFDSRMEFGISQQLHVQNIMVPVDGINDRVFTRLIILLNDYLTEHDDARVVIFTREPGLNVRERLEEKINMILKVDVKNYTWEDKARNIEEADLEDDEQVRLKIDIAQCVDEMSVSKCIREQRIVVDMRDVPDLYLRISAVSTGIPQILRYDSQYIEDGRNGFVLEDIRKVTEKISYYLDSLANWNEAMVYTYELGQQYTTEKLLQRWKEVIDSFELY